MVLIFFTFGNEYWLLTDEAVSPLDKSLNGLVAVILIISYAKG